MVSDMTKGSCAKQILAFGLPLLAGNILQQLYNFVDTIVVGRGISVDALAAVGLTGSLNFFVLGFVIGLTQGVSILVSQYFGAKDVRSIRKSITMSFLLCALSALLITLFSLWGCDHLLRWIHTPEYLMQDASSYIRIIFACMFISTMYNFYSGILRAFGDSKNPLIAMILAFFVNTILDIVFVIPCHMGVAGAALATVIAQAISALYCFVFVQKIEEARLQKQDWAFDPHLFKRSFFLSFPVAIMNSITAIGVMILQSAINGFGSIYIAGYTAASKIVIILEQLPSTFGFATGTFVGQNLGADRLDRIKTGVKNMNWIMVGLCVGCAFLMFVFGRPLMQVMVGKQEVETLETGYHCLWMLSIFLVALGLLWLYRCSLQSMGDTFWPMISGIVELVARMVAVAFFPRWFGFDGVLFAEVSAWISAALMLGFVYQWTIKTLSHKKNLMESVPYEA